MDKKRVLLLSGALAIAIVTAVMARGVFLGSSSEPSQAMNNVLPAKPKGPQILVAKRTLPVGTIITAESLTYQPWPSELIENAYFIKDKSSAEDFLGTVVRSTVNAGQPISQGALVKPGERGFLAAALGAGMRAVTVPVSDNTSVAGFVFPGDRVDLILTQTVDGDGDSLRASETIIRNLRVLATDQRTTPEKDDAGETKVVTYSTVTVEATPKLAEKISVAQTVGTLSLSLRSLADNEAELEQAIASGALSVPDGEDPAEEVRFLSRAADRPMESRDSFVTGGDISRFQRSTPPPKARQSDGSPSATGEPAKPKGPVVNVARGNVVAQVPVGKK